MVSAGDYAKPYLYAYAKNGGQVQDPNGDRESGFDDTRCPVDFEQSQVTTLHRVLVTPLMAHCHFRLLSLSILFVSIATLLDRTH